jgi:hypothetical protein
MACWRVGVLYAPHGVPVILGGGLGLLQSNLLGRYGEMRLASNLLVYQENNGLFIIKIRTTQQRPHATFLRVVLRGGVSPMTFKNKLLKLILPFLSTPIIFLFLHIGISKIDYTPIDFSSRTLLFNNYDLECISLGRCIASSYHRNLALQYQCPEETLEEDCLLISSEPCSSIAQIFTCLWLNKH